MILVMKPSSKVITFKGRFLGITFLVVIQFINGIIHTFSGLALFLGGYIPVASSSMEPLIFSFYTLIYGLMSVFFTYLLWNGKRLGWIGTVAISLFVIIADILTVFDLLTFLGIIKTAAIGEVPYSALIIIYLLQKHVRLKYEIKL